MMIVQRLSKAFGQQNWASVVIELVVLMLGIFLALQADSWNQDRKDRVLEQRYLTELAVDIEADIAEIDETLAAATQLRSGAAFILQSLQLEDSEPQPPLPISFPQPPPLAENLYDRLPFVMLYVRRIDGNGHAFQELVTTGNLSIIRDRRLVRELTRYYSHYRDLLDGEELIRHRLLERMNIYGEYSLAPFQPMPDTEFLQLVADNPRLASEVKLARDMAMLQFGLLLPLKAEAQSVLAMLREARAQ